MEEVTNGISDFTNELHRAGYAALGVLLNFVRTLWLEKNKIDLFTTATQRKSAWKTYWRQNWEDSPVALVTAVIFTLVLDVMVLVYDAWQNTNYDSKLDDAYVSYGISFLLGLFALKIMDKLFAAGNNKLS